MKRISGFVALFLLSGAAWAQDNNYESLARLFSQTNPQGSARMQAMGGTHTALGADVTTLSANPAGLGFYTRSELSISPMFSQMNNSSQYLGRTQDASANQFTLGNIGIVLAGDKRNPVGSSRWVGGAFGASYSRQNILKNSIRFGGRNTYSSMADYFAEYANNEARASAQGVTAFDFKKDLVSHGSVFDYPTSMYYYGKLINPNSATGPDYTGTELGKATNQAFAFNSSGYTSQWNFAYGANYMNKLYIGLGFALARMNYTTSKVMTENFENPDAVSGFTYNNDLTTSGKGFNISAGVIYRPSDLVRLGLSVTTPTWYTITESAGQGLQTRLQRRIEVSDYTNPEYDNGLPGALRSAGFGVATQNGINYITSIPQLSILPFDSQYHLRTPMKLAGGLGLFFGKVGFISLDAELINYSNMKFSSDDPNADGGLSDGYYTGIVRNTYRNVANFKLGGEVRADQVSFRAGISYYQDPYKQTSQFNSLDRARWIYSGGIGYKTDKFYADAAVLYGVQTTAYTPYILSTTQDYASAKIKNTTTTGVLTVGVYF